MSCWIGDYNPKNREELFRPIKLYNNELIAYQNGLKVDPDDIRYTLNAVYQEDESCLFCKAKEDGEYYVFYGTFGSLFDELMEDLERNYFNNHGLEDGSFILELKPFRAEILFKLKIKYYDALYFFKRRTEEALNLHREWIDECGDEYLY